MIAIITSHQVKDSNGKMFFESLSLQEAKNFIAGYDREHGIVLELYEAQRMPTDHRKSAR